MTDKFDSTDDRRTENSAVRHEYRTLTEDEKTEITEIKDAGAEVLDSLQALASSLAKLANTIAPSADYSRERYLAMKKLVDGFAIEDDTDGITYSKDIEEQMTAVEEAVMWAVKDITR